jgi:outer membrane receptor protein involved in Fe transport
VSALRQPARIAPHLLADALVFLALPIRANGAEPDVGDEKGPLEQVIVTAQFRRENLEQTPLSMTVVSADTLTRHNMTTLTDVGDVVPNVTLGPGGTGAGKSVLAFIRGVGTGDYQYTVEPGVAVYLDDVFLSGQFGNAFDLLDLDRVEVLRGPQGTLFGKNSIGGAILLTSRKPQGDGTGSLELTTGDFSRKEARGFFDVPLIRDELSLRLAAGSRQRDGYVDRLDYACVHPDLGGVVDPTAPFLLSSNRTAGHCSVGTGAGESIQSARASLRWHRNDALDAQLSVDWMNDHSGAGAQALIAIDDSPGSPVKSEAFDRRLRVNIAAFLSRYKDLQLSVFELDAMGIPFSTTVNQGRAQITGTEIEVEARPLPPLTVSAAFGLNHYTNKDLGTAINCDRVANPVSTPAPGANCTQGGPLPGSPLPSLPERTASLAIEYELRFADGSIVRPRLDATFQSRIYFDAVGTPEAAVPGRTLLNGRLTWDIGHSPWEVALSATNLTNKAYFEYKSDLRAVYGMLIGLPGPPREWAVTVKRTFD